MVKIPRLSKQMRMLCLALLLGLFTWLVFTPVRASAEFNSRLSNLEFDRNRLKVKVNQLETQKSRPRLSTPSPLVFPAGLDRQAEPTVDRLATLVIELKERLTKVEAEVSTLKKQVSP